MVGRARIAAIAAGVAAAVIAPLLQIWLDPISYVAGGLAYLLVLTALAIALWIGLRLKGHELGWRRGRALDYAIALIYPLVVMTALAGYAWASGAIGDVSAIDEAKLARDAALMGGATFVAVLLTEEGFFRGALWGAAMRAQWPAWVIVAWTTVAFVGWHLAVPFIDKNYAVPPSVLPLYFINATLLGASWGLLRLASNSVLVACLAHAVWNGLAYTLFGAGDEAGALGVTNFGAFDPERGVAGIVANGAVVLVLALWAFRSGSVEARRTVDNGLANEAR